MANLTRNGIAYNLHDSPHKETLDYDDDEIEYVFSSATYRLKFLSRCGENRRIISNSLSKRFGFKVKNEILSDLVLYSKIEKRGFLLKVNGVNVECLENITLDGKNLIIKS